MALYKWDNESLVAATPVTFEGEELFERQDLQRVLRDAPEVLEEGLFVIAEEYSNWEESSRSIDLLALDSDGRLVVVELKRTLTGNHMDLQAVRYAAMVSNMTFEQVVEAHREYLDRRSHSGNPADRICEHLGESNPSIDSSVPRIVLASGGFSTELTASVLWLNDNGLEIACIRLDLYRDDDRLYLSSTQVIPFPQAHDYQIRIRDKNKEERVRASRARELEGPDDFRDSIRSAPVMHREELTRLYEWAMTLKEQGVCSHFVTSFSVKRDDYGLKPLLREGKKGKRGCLVTIYNRRPPRIWIRMDWLAKCAPNSIELVNKEMRKKSSTGNTIKSPIPEELLAALFKAHQEAARNINDQSVTS